MFTLTLASLFSGFMTRRFDRTKLWIFGGIGLFAVASLFLTGLNPGSTMRNWLPLVCGAAFGAGISLQLSATVVSNVGRNAILQPDGKICILDWGCAGCYPLFFDLYPVTCNESSEPALLTPLLQQLSCLKTSFAKELELLRQVQRANTVFSRSLLLSIRLPDARLTIRPGLPKTNKNSGHSMASIHSPNHTGPREFDLRGVPTQNAKRPPTATIIIS